MVGKGAAVRVRGGRGLAPGSGCLVLDTAGF